MRSLSVCWVVLTAILPVAAAASVTIRSSGSQVPISVVRRVDVSYHILTRRQPLEFDAKSDSGRGWLRVYTRLWWPVGAAGRQVYTLSLWQGESEREFRFETVLSASSYGPGRHQVGSWRSFFVELPTGTTSYRLALTGGAETVAVRIVHSSPRPWRSLELAGLPRVAVEDQRNNDGITPMYAVKPGDIVPVTVRGPARLRLRVRLNYDATMAGEQGLMVGVTLNDSLLFRRGLRVVKEPGASCLDMPACVPSRERSLRLSVGPGDQRLCIKVTGTVAKTALVAVDYLSGEVYEE